MYPMRESKVRERHRFYMSRKTYFENEWRWVFICVGLRGILGFGGYFWP